MHRKIRIDTKGVPPLISTAQAGGKGANGA